MTSSNTTDNTANTGNGDTDWTDAARLRRLKILYGFETDPDRAEHPIYKRSHWKAEVANDNTLTGYWEWVSFMIWAVENK